MCEKDRERPTSEVVPVSPNEKIWVGLNPEPLTGVDRVFRLIDEERAIEVIGFREVSGLRVFFDVDRTHLFQTLPIESPFQYDKPPTDPMPTSLDELEKMSMPLISRPIFKYETRRPGIVPDKTSSN